MSLWFCVGVRHKHIYHEYLPPNLQVNKDRWPIKGRADQVRGWLLTTSTRSRPPLHSTKESRERGGEFHRKLSVQEAAVRFHHRRTVFMLHSICIWWHLKDVINRQMMTDVCACFTSAADPRYQKHHVSVNDVSVLVFHSTVSVTLFWCLIV